MKRCKDCKWWQKTKVNKALPKVWRCTVLAICCMNKDDKYDAYVRKWWKFWAQR